jgi:acyl-CoA thioester hydrolase
MAQEYVRKVNYYETDKMGVTHHSNYVRFMEEARIDYLEQIGCSYDKMEKEGIISPVIGIECEYKRSTTFGDELRIHVELIEYKRVKLSVAYTMINTKTEEIVFVGKSHHCFLNTEGRPIALSKQYPEYDELLKAHVAEND